VHAHLWRSCQLFPRRFPLAKLTDDRHTSMQHSKRRGVGAVLALGADVLNGCQPGKPQQAQRPACSSSPQSSRVISPARFPRLAQQATHLARLDIVGDEAPLGRLALRAAVALWRVLKRRGVSVDVAAVWLIQEGGAGGWTGASAARCCWVMTLQRWVQDSFDTCCCTRPRGAQATAPLPAAAHPRAKHTHPRRCVRPALSGALSACGQSVGALASWAAA
jgi:hypothetical protein